MQIIFNIPDAQVPRVADMVRARMPDADEQGQPITYTNNELLAEFKTIIREHIKGLVQQHELLQEHERVFSEYSPIEPT